VPGTTPRPSRCWWWRQERFPAAERDAHAPAQVRLSSGGNRPAIACFTPLSAISGPYEYPRFAYYLWEEHDVLDLPAPGLSDGRPLPDGYETLAQLQVDALHRQLGDQPVVLLGHSGGGCVANRVAAGLEDRGYPTHRIDMVDTYLSETVAKKGMTWLLPALLDGMLDRVDRYVLDFRDRSGNV
jgi:thioesterase domain-containing protein